MVQATLAPTAMQNFAARVLRRSGGLLRFLTYNGFRIDPLSDFRAVASAIAAGNIRVLYFAAGQSGNFNAGYVGSGYILLPNYSTSTISRKFYLSRLVHEAVHASFDLQGATAPFSMPTYDDEAFAYVMQALYLIHFGTTASFFASPSVNQPLADAYGVARLCPSIWPLCWWSPEQS
jgi:hypothetical protein